MKQSIVCVIVVLLFISCNKGSGGNNKKVKEEKMCLLLGLSEPEIVRVSSITEVKVSNIGNRIELSEKQKKKLFAKEQYLIESDSYLCAIKKVDKNCYVLFVLVDGILGKSLYALTVDCSSNVKDFVSLDECDLFDLVDEDEFSETGMFISKYFKIMNDSLVSARSIIKEEKKNIDNDKILSFYQDSITLNYLINEDGKLELMSKDSVRVRMSLGSDM